MAQNARRARGAQSRSRRTEYRVEGNTIRKTAPSEEQRRRAHRQRSYSNEQDRRARAHRSATRNRQRALAMSPAYVAFLSVCVVVVCLICGAYIYLQSQMTMHVSSISALESEVLDLQSDNTEAMQRVETTIDLDSIREKAEVLGMTYPQEDQIVYYDALESDKMTQYSNVTTEEESVFSALFK